MTEPSYLDTPQGRRIAYHFTAGEGPCVVFLGGLKSDMEGTKAVHLEDWAQATGRAFLRFDYSGHGQSSGTFEEGRFEAMHFAGQILKDPSQVNVNKYASVDYNGNELLHLIRQARVEAQKHEWGNAGVYLGQIGRDVIKGDKSE